MAKYEIHGSTVNIYESPEKVEIVLASLTHARQELAAPAAGDQQTAQILAKLDELQKAIKEGKPKSALEGIWKNVKGMSDVATLMEKIPKVVEAVSNWLGSGTPGA